MKIYELLGLKPGQKFLINDGVEGDNQFMFNLKDELKFYSEFTKDWYLADKRIVVDLIHTPELIEIIEEENMQENFQENSQENTFELSEHDILVLISIQQFYGKTISRVSKIRIEKGFRVEFECNTKFLHVESCRLDCLNKYLKDYNSVVVSGKIIWTNTMKCFMEILKD